MSATVFVSAAYTKYLVGWCLTSSEQFFRTRTFKNLNATGLETRKGNGYGRILLPVQQVSYGPLIMSIMLIMSCYTVFFNFTCAEGGNLSTRDLGFIYVSSVGRVGCEFLHPAQPTDAASSRRSSRSHFYTPGFPRGSQNIWLVGWLCTKYLYL